MPTRRPSVALGACLAALAFVATTVRATGSFEDGARADEVAERIEVDRPRVAGPIRTVAFIGDSLIADYRQIIDIPPAYTNEVVPLVAAQLDLRLGRGAVTVENHGVGGLAVKYPLPAFTQNGLRAELRARFGAPSTTRPDLVVIAVSSLDLANVVRPIEQLAPELVAELQLAVVELRSIGVEAVLVPAVPPNPALFGLFQPAAPDLPGRVRYLNESMAASTLPMLFESFDGFDADRDGAPDDQFYVDYHHRLFDDGIHLNRAGQTVHAGTVGPRLADVIQIANDGRRS